MKPGGPPWGIVHCIYSVEIGGQEMVVLSLAANADRTRFTPRVLCIQATGELLPRFEAEGIPVDVLAPSIQAGPIRAMFALRRYLQQHRPAILHTHNSAPHQLGALAAAAARVPIVVHTKHGRGQQMTAKGRWLQRMAGRLTDVVVPVSTDAAAVASVVEGVPAGRIQVIHNGIAVGAVPAEPAADARWRAVHVARLNLVKDQATLLRAARLVIDREPRFELDVIGDGEERLALERLASELGIAGRVHFHGFQHDVRGYLVRAGQFVLSSVSEGIALTLLEAMAAGLPVVATDVGGNREVVVQGQTGLLVAPQDPRALADAMLSLMADPAKARALGTAGRERVVRNFSLETTIEAYQALYLKLLRRRLGREAVA